MEHEILTGALRPGPDCVDVERLGRYVDGALVGDERAAVKAHVDGCLTCQTEISMLNAFASVRTNADEADAVRAIVAELQRRPSPIPRAAREESRASRIFPLGFARAIIASAALFAVAAGGAFLYRSHAPQLPADIDAGHDVTRSLSVTLRAPIGDLRTAPGRLEWQPVAGAVRYHVRVMEVDRTELWSSDAASASIDLPDAVRARIVPAKTLLWDVTAFGSSNATLAASDAQRFRLVP